MPRKRKAVPEARLDDGKGNQRLKDGLEMLDPTPLAIPTRLTRPETLAERVANMMRGERLRAALHAEELETFDEAEDFDIGDDYDPTSPWENDFDLPIDTARRILAERAQAVRDGLKSKEGEPSTIVTPAPGGPPQPVVSGGGKAGEP